MLLRYSNSASFPDESMHRKLISSDRILQGRVTPGLFEPWLLFYEIGIRLSCLQVCGEEWHSPRRP